MAILCTAVACQKSDDRDELYRRLWAPGGIAHPYRNAEGLYEPRAIKLTPNVVAKIDGDHAIFEIRTPGSYTVSAGDLSISIKVMNGD